MNTNSMFLPAGKPIIRPTIRASAADLLGTKPVEKKDGGEFDNSDESQIREAIRDKYGDKEAKEFVPSVTVRPRTVWLQEGYAPNDGETALCYIHTYRNKRELVIALFHEKQVSPL